MGLKGYYMRYMLVGPHNDEAPLFPVYATHVEDMPSLHGHRADQLIKSLYFREVKNPYE